MTEVLITPDTHWVQPPRDYESMSDGKLIMIAREQKYIIGLCKGHPEEAIRRADVLQIVAVLKTRGLNPFPEYITNERPPENLRNGD